MRHFQRTTLSIAAAQVALSWSTAAFAQTPAAPAAPASAASAAGAGQVIVISGQRAAIMSAQKIKKESEEIVDSIVAEDIGKLPDRSVSEVLQRVVGVSMDRIMVRGDPTRYSPEGSGVIIRGLPYVSSQLNGRESFSANGGRMLGFEDVSPELMAGVDVYKNPSAEQTEGAIAGLVNLRTAMPFDFKGYKVSLSAKAATSPLRGSTKPEYSGLVSNIWDTSFGRFGALLDLAHTESSLRTDSMTVDPFYPATTKNAAGQYIATGKWFPKAMGWKTLEFDRTRDGVYAALQWRRGDLQSSLSLFHSRYKYFWSEFNIQASYNPYDMQLANDQYDSSGALVYGTLRNSVSATGIPMNANTRFSDRNSKTNELAWNLSWALNDRWTLSTDLQLVKSKTASIDSTVATGINMPKQTFDLGGSLPRMVFDQADLANLANPANYYWAFTMENLDKGTGDQKAWKADARVRLDHPVFNDLRFGVRLTDREATTQNSNPAYHWAAVTQTWQAGSDGWQPLASLAYLSRFPGDTAVRPFSNFMGGKSTVSPLVMPTMDAAAGFPGSYQKLHDYAKLLCEEAHGVGSDVCKGNSIPWSPATFDPNDFAGLNRQKEKTQAAYAQLRFGFDDWKMPLDGNVGLRLVQTKNRADGAAVFTADPPPAAGAPTEIAPTPVFASFSTPLQTSNDFTNVLPSLNLRLKASEQLQYRFAAAQAISRPEFSKLQAYTTLKQEYLRHDVNGVPTIYGLKLTGEAKGNPLLKPVRSNQFDLTGEYYFSRTGSLTVAAFDKELKDIILNQTSTTAVKAGDGRSFTFITTAPVNGAKGWARGMEFAFQRYLDMLPGWLSGFGLQANYTRANSKQDRYNAVYSTYCNTGAGADNLNLNINGCDTDGRSFTGLPMTNISKHTANLALLYDYGPVSARVAYNWRSKYLFGVALNSDNTGPNQTDALDTNPASSNFGQHNLPLGLPLWGDNYGQLDLGFQYKFLDDKLALGFDAQNVTKSVYKILMQQNIGTRGHLYQQAGARYSVSVRYTY